MKALYENKWCRIINKDGYYILQSKSEKYNDQYFATLEAAKKSIGVN